MDPEAEVQAIIDKETNAWNAYDADTLVSIFHPDMVKLISHFGLLEYPLGDR